MLGRTFGGGASTEFAIAQEGKHYSLRDIDIDRKFISYGDNEAEKNAINRIANDLDSRGKFVLVTDEQVAKYADVDRLGNYKVARAYLKSILKSFMGDSVYFEYNGNRAEVYLTKDGVNHSVGGDIKSDKVAIFQQFKDLVKKAEYVFSTKNDIHSNANKTIGGRIDWDCFVALAKIGDKKYPVVFKIRTIDQDVRSQIYEMATKKEVDSSHDHGQREKPLDELPDYGVVPSTSKNSIRNSYPEVKKKLSTQRTLYAAVTPVAKNGSNAQLSDDSIQSSDKNVKEKSAGKANTTQESGRKYSLRLKYTDGHIEELADARNLTEEQAAAYLHQAKSGKLRGETYIPVRKDTPQVLIDALAQVNEKIENRSLVMQVRKAQQAMSSSRENKGGRKYGRNVRHHGLSESQIVEIMDNLDNPSEIICQTNRFDNAGNPLPDNIAVFVEYGDGENVAVIEFDSTMGSGTIGTEFGDTKYHTVVTVFQPDTVRDGMGYDYMEELLSDPNNFALEK